VRGAEIDDGAEVAALEDVLPAGQAEAALDFLLGAVALEAVGLQNGADFFFEEGHARCIVRRSRSGPRRARGDARRHRYASGRDGEHPPLPRFQHALQS
jgi:hypothetical protein